tara:strand:- start:4699 stop:7485 length:2787 start_codon:yes stop_codon:yes gene_type:complete
MAAPGKEIELLAGGTEQDDQRRVGWAQNLWKIRGTVSVRPGWGQVAELDTTLGLDIKKSSNPAKFDSVDFGYTKMLGAEYIKTSFGNEQIVSLFLARCNSGNTFGEDKAFRWDFYLVARIFDLTTRRHWEEVFHQHTSERNLSEQFSTTGFSAQITPALPSTWQGCYESAYDLDNSTFIPGREEPEWFFQVYQDSLYFGAPSQGVFMYQPVDFKDLRYQQIETSEEFDWASGYSESPLIKRLSFTPGIYQDGFVYAESSGLTKIQSSSVFRDRMAYATEHEVFFSDPGRPSNVIAVNFIQCPSANKITALGELRGNLLIFTSRETYLYIPSEGTIVSRGRPPVSLSSNIGCVGPSALTSADNKLMWVSHTGIHSTSDGSSIVEISGDIRSFWKVGGLMTNPTTSYFETANNGYVDISAVTPPRTLLQFEPENVTLAYNEGKQALIMNAPHLNGSWCLTSNMWSWWPYESIASETAGGAPEVNTVQNLINPWVISSDTDFFTVCGINLDSIQNDAYAHLDGNPVGYAALTKGSNFVLTKLGYGGALDRSCVSEDQRLGSSKYISVSKAGPTVTSRIYFRPLELEESVTGSIYWAPIEIVPLTPSAAWTGNIVSYAMTFKFDNIVWDCNSDAAGLITPRIPNERTKSSTGFTLVAETDGAGAVLPGGGHITVTWAGAGIAPGSYVNQPSLNLTPRNSNPLIDLPFTPLTTTKTEGGLGILMMSSVVIDSAGNADSTLATLAWCGMVLGTDNKHISNAKVQAVDWAYKSRQIVNPGIQMRARGIYARMQGTGIGSTLIVPNWIWGVYNIVLGSDNKEYTTQIVDYNNDITKIENKSTIRSRFQNSTANMVGRLFGTSVVDTPKWGSILHPTEGDYLIDDTQTDTIAISDSVKGETISYMVFGFIRNRASSLAIESLRGVFRRAGGRRRVGR